MHVHIVRGRNRNRKGRGHFQFLMEIGRTTHMSTLYTIQYPPAEMPPSGTRFFKKHEEYFACVMC